MELSSFSECIVTVPFERNGVTVELQVNIDAFTPEFFRQLSTRLTAKIRLAEAKEKKAKQRKKETAIFENEATALEIKRAINIEFLIPSVLKGWDLTENEVPVAPTKEVLMTFSPRLVEELMNACIKAAQTVKKTEDSEETLPATHDGSTELRVVGQSS